MSLSIRDILLLDYFNGKPIHTKIPKYQQRLYGADGDLRMRALCEEGWARVSQPRETVGRLPDKALAQALAAHDLPAEGSHADLVRRVTDNIPQTEYAHAVPRIYLVTPEGEKALASHMAYVLNARHGYGFSEGEIGEARRALTAKGTASASTILIQAFSQKSALFVMAGEWSKLRNLYFGLSNFYLRADEKEKALTYLYLVFFLDMSGMENRNHLVDYEKLFPTQKGIIVLMDQIRKGLGLDDRAVKSSFLSALARTAPRLPFSYFSPQIVGDILVERLNGVEFSHTRYLSVRNVPDPTAAAYRYTPPARAERPAPAPLPKTPPVPPVLRLPTFAAPAPFVPEKAKETRRDGTLQRGGRGKRDKKSPGLLDKLTQLWHKDGE